MTNRLEQWDQELFLFFNGAHNSFFDFLMPWISNKFVWIPLYTLLLYWLIRNHRRREVHVLISIGLLILISDQVASGILKPTVERLRPCYEPALQGKVHLLKGCGGQYGFASSHASNAFGVAFFCWLLLKDRLKYIWLLIPWAALVAYSRVYLGVHYPGDVITGALIGIVAAWLVTGLFRYTGKKLQLKT
jgi:undecaprenyl-diphosphatase